MACVPIEWVAYMVVTAVVLAVVSPKAWHDVALDAARQRLGVDPGGSAVEDSKERRHR